MYESDYESEFMKIRSTLILISTSEHVSLNGRAFHMAPLNAPPSPLDDDNWFVKADMLQPLPRIGLNTINT